MTGGVARRLTEQEGRKLQQIVRRGERVGEGPAGVDHHGVGVGDDGAGDDRPARPGARGHRRDVIHSFNERGWRRWTFGGREAVPARSAVTTSSTSSRRPPRTPGQARPPVHALEHPQARRLSG